MTTNHHRPARRAPTRNARPDQPPEHQAAAEERTLREVVLIQAFMHRPRLLILDEPTNGLDPLNQQEFHRMLKEVRDEGRTVFLSSHILSEVEQTCSRVGIIRAGQLVRVGGVAELMGIKRHQITITFATAVPAEAFKQLSGVAQLETLADGHTLRLTMPGLELDGGSWWLPSATCSQAGCARRWTPAS